MLVSRNGEEHDLSEPLFQEHSEADASDHLGAVLLDDHRFMVAVEDQLDDVLLGHLGQLPAKDVLEIEQLAHALVSLVVANHHKLNDPLVLFVLGTLVAIGKPEPCGLA